MCDHPNREAAMVTLRRDERGVSTVWCDPCLAPLVGALNDAGLDTVWSCCGHGRRPATVGLRDGRQILVLDDLEQLHALDHLWPAISDPIPAHAAPSKDRR